MRRCFGGFGKVAGFVGLALALLVAGSLVVLAVDVNNFVIKDLAYGEFGELFKRMLTNFAALFVLFFDVL